uniref:Uncharacterized protein n=1 Tax=Panagrolaimus superbus TaxID=310955 RepID=A0A914XTQ0_9BILA
MMPTSMMSGTTIAVIVGGLSAAPTGMISTNSTGIMASGMTTMKPMTVAGMTGGSTIVAAAGGGGGGVTGMPSAAGTTMMASSGGLGADHSKACAALVCTFDPATPCINDLIGTVWKTSNMQIGNNTLSVTPDSPGNTFAYVTGPLRWSRLLLDPFELEKTVSFVFNFKLSLQTTTLAKLTVYAKRNDSLVETSLVTVSFLLFNLKL